MGMAVNLRKIDPPRANETVYARLSLSSTASPVTTVLGRVHATPMGAAQRVGFRFLPDAPDAEELLDLLTRHVLEAQRELRQPE